MELLFNRLVHVGRFDRIQELMLAPPRFRPERSDWAQAGLVAAVLFGLYALTAPRTVGTEDDGLFVLSSYFLGIEHPPGYPLFILIGHLFTNVPIGSIAYRVHLASAFFGALTCAAAWLCSRALTPGRTPAYLSAIGLGISPVFWSQAIIAEVYTLNTFFFLVLLYLGLQVRAVAEAQSVPPSQALLPWMAFVFGLSLSNHYPLMLLVAPAFAILLWPARKDIFRAFPVLILYLVLGLLPYAWLIYRSWQPLPISFYGPLETPREIWYFLSRSGYGEIDQSATANWLDRIKFFEFLASEVFVQFAVVGTLLAGIAVAIQWRTLGQRIGGALTVAFVMPSIVLLILLNFDYDSIHKHIYHVYPLPAYAVAALWMGHGWAHVSSRFRLKRSSGIAAVIIMLMATFGMGARSNLFDDEEWLARFALTVLRVLPKDAVVFTLGDPDLAPMAYFHMIENQRPDITLYQGKGLVLGNRLFHAQRTSEEASTRVLRQMVAEQTKPVVATFGAISLGAVKERWLYAERDPASADPNGVTVDIPEEAVRFFEEEVAEKHGANAWVAFIQGELRRLYALSFARSLPRGAPLTPRARRHLELLGRDFYGVLGLAEGLMESKEGYAAGVVGGYLERARELMPPDVLKEYLGRYFQLRGVLRASLGDRPAAVKDMETAISVWPATKNPAIGLLGRFYREDGNLAADRALQDRVKTFKRHRF